MIWLRFLLDCVRVALGELWVQQTGIANHVVKLFGAHAGLLAEFLTALAVVAVEIEHLDWWEDTDQTQAAVGNDAHRVYRVLEPRVSREEVVQLLAQNPT